MVKTHIYVRYEVLSVVNIKVMDFWKVPLCSLVDGYQTSRGINFLSLKGGGVKMEAAGSPISRT
jgi:hypothetical protein